MNANHSADKELQPEISDSLSSVIDSVLLIIARVGANLLALIWTVLMVRLVDPSAAGIVFSAISLAQLSSIFLTLNIESGSMRAIVSSLQGFRLGDAASFMHSNHKIILLTLPIAATIALSVGAQYSISIWLVLYVCIAAVMTAKTRLVARHATALGVMRRGLLPRLLTGPIVLTLGLGSYSILGLEFTPEHALALFAISEALTFFTQKYFLRDAFQRIFVYPHGRLEWRRWISLGLWLTPGLMMSEYRKALFILIAALALPPSDLTLFVIAFSIVNLINFGVIAVDVAFSPRIAHALIGSRMVVCNRLLGLSGIIKLAGFLIGVILIFSIGQWLLSLFGKEYISAWPTLLVFLTLPMSSIVFGPASVIITSAGLGRIDFIGSVLGGVSILIFILLGGSFFGVIGAALGAVLGQTVGLFYMTLKCRQILGVDSSVFSIRYLR